MAKVAREMVERAGVNVDQLIERLKYDILYIENMSLYVDFKILIYTVLTIFRGRGV